MERKNKKGEKRGNGGRRRWEFTNNSELQFNEEEGENGGKEARRRRGGIGNWRVRVEAARIERQIRELSERLETLSVVEAGAERAGGGEVRGVDLESRVIG